MASNCESCVNYVYDEEEECYCCDMNLDEDDMVKFLTGNFDNCPYYQLDDEYSVAALFFENSFASVLNLTLRIR